VRLDERLLARRPLAIFVNPFKRGEIGPDLFRAACNMGLEAPRPAISGWQIEALDHGEEPGASGDEAGQRFIRLNAARYCAPTGGEREQVRDKISDADPVRNGADDGPRGNTGESRDEQQQAYQEA
jgi:hypothetical protein